jgi:hypothetical protein
MLLGDAARLLKEVVKKTTLQQAFRHAIHDRYKECFYDPFELEWAQRSEAVIVQELVEELRDPLNYRLKPAYAYFLPKSDLCYRRMIYIPFKDLVVRYAFGIVVGDLVDPELSLKCFANRRDFDIRAGRFLQDFAKVSWPNFCEWQRNNSNDGTLPTLLRTDISAFYDSISHKYLIEDIESTLDLPAGSKFMKLFRILLRVPVISYSHLTRTQRQAKTMHQGLCTGNSTEGFFANVYLKGIDQDMAQMENIDFGRYNDDMRIFAKDRPSAKQAMLALQERLLTKALNLNSSKTQFEDDKTGVEKLLSRAYEGEDYSADDEDATITRPAVTDKAFDEFDTDFEIGQKLGKFGKDGKDFCLFLGKRITLSERQPGHVEMLHEILRDWHGSARHAAWRLVESIVGKECPKETRDLAEGILLECLSDPNVANYTKYRLLHQLVKARKSIAQNSVYRYCTGLRNRTVEKVKGLLPSFLAETAFELNIITLYAMRALGASFADLQSAVRENACKPVPLPIKNALSLARQPGKPKLFPVLVPIGDEETEIEDHY